MGIKSFPREFERSLKEEFDAPFYVED